ncbi:lipoyl(octanoyl) transferase LipB [Gluconacetobacter takamatsuzukensis]|uniref:Octanoyltransferase n=1 Tax=Gluconacetobacter takamatsuzukensis TaxID=1286190 RepID=A0A7W4KCI8_9PROT|nr:lipoyl(octanoyl) transferase LipB [Gluconacetobacter takamatsuzukensis]MBB2204350.1 lipoyl(octanoyl) transferase LipB [Gluconacetobacter takamatsuzukensis]
MQVRGAMTEKTILWNSSQAPIPYPEAIAGMERQVAGIRDGSLPERVWLLEHPPTYTAGTSARDADLFNPSGFPTHAAGRGGQWTYHGPGQRVAYVMLDLTRQQGTVPARDLRAYVHALEEWLIRTLRRFDVTGERRADRIGVWVVDPVTGRESKIAALGVRVTRWTCWHGVALNVAPDLSHFEGIVPCGIREHGVTSLHALGHDVDMATVDEALRASWQPLFGSVPTPIEET